MDDLTIGVLAGILVLLLHRVWRWLSRKAKSGTSRFLKSCYLSDLTAVINGHAAAPIVVLLVAVFLFQALQLQADLHRQFNGIEHEVEKLERDLRLLEGGEQPQQPQSPEEAKSVLSAIRQELRLAPWLVLGMSALMLGVAVWWGFQALQRARLAAAVNRFQLRVQGLAKREELAALASAELRVRDRASLAAYLQVAYEISKRHSVVELVREIAPDDWQPRDEAA